MERATVCVDEVDKMSTVIAGKPNPIGVVLQQGLLTLMEGERVPYRLHAFDGEKDREQTVEIDTRKMMFVCGGAFEGLYDQVYNRVSRSGSGERIKTEAVKTADGGVRLETRFSLADFLKIKDLFEYGMVPQFMARFDKVVVLNDLNTAILKEILLGSYDSPLARTQRYFESLDIVLEIDDMAAAMIAERAAQENRTGARALRDVFSEIVNPIEFDPSHEGQGRSTRARAASASTSSASSAASADPGRSPPSAETSSGRLEAQNDLAAFAGEDHFVAVDAVDAAAEDELADADQPAVEIGKRRRLRSRRCPPARASCRRQIRRCADSRRRPATPPWPAPAAGPLASNLSGSLTLGDGGGGLKRGFR